MAEEESRIIKISVRELVEFILRTGDIDNTMAHGDMSSMSEGSRLHRKLQKAEGSGYRAEVSLKHSRPCCWDGEEFVLQVEGRADGIFRSDRPFWSSAEQAARPEDIWGSNEELTCIDEIKTTLRNVQYMEAPVPVHRYQAMCYAYIYALQNELCEIGVRMTYCHQETEEIRYFRELFTFSELSEWFEKLTDEYAKWTAWHLKWLRCRDASIAESHFPFEYREGQRELVGNVYRTINRGKKLFIEAPTGVGKTISTVFPAVWALGEGKIDRIFYGTAKTIARTVAEEAFSILGARGMKLKAVTITSKEKLCVLEKPECNPSACPRAKGHFDRVNEAVFDMLTHEECIDRRLVEEYAQKHNVCPFEMCLDVTSWSDVVICDYNYIFDPSVHLKRFFENDTAGKYCFLIDEAHNLVERAREMYSAELIKEDFLAARAVMTKSSLYEAHQLVNALEGCNRVLLSMKRECDEFEVWEECGRLVTNLERFTGIYEDISSKLNHTENEALIDLYFAAHHFLNMYENMDDDYCIYSDYREDRHFRLRLQCMDPSRNLKEYLAKGRTAVFFSATLLPVKYYVEQLGGAEDDYCVYAPSPFDPSKRLLMVAGDVSTKYTRRNDSEYSKIATYIEDFVTARRGNYLVFFPSYSMMESIAALLEDRLSGLCLQSRTMNEAEKEAFLDSFDDNPENARIGFCVMGGIFSEGIDLKNDRLIGVVVVGTGLPMVCNERELFRGYFDEKKKMGFEYAYLYNGMNKVQQAAGRVIRTTEDTGAILLLDERFLNRQYTELFPREWADYVRVTSATMKRKLEEFWAGIS